MEVPPQSAVVLRNAIAAVTEMAGPWLGGICRMQHMLPPSAPPLILVDASDEILHQRSRSFAEWDGSSCTAGDDSGPGPVRRVHVGAIEDAFDASRALLLASRGSGLIARAAAEPAVIEALFEDLRRVGEAEYLTGEFPARPEDPLALDPDQVELLDLLASGVSVIDAAKRLHISRRTAQRRLAAAKVALGVRSPPRR